jgi:hypothetical protein
MSDQRNDGQRPEVLARLDKIASDLRELSGELDNLLLLSSEVEGISMHIDKLCLKQ